MDICRSLCLLCGIVVSHLCVAPSCVKAVLQQGVACHFYIASWCVNPVSHHKCVNSVLHNGVSIPCCTTVCRFLCCTILCPFRVAPPCVNSVVQHGVSMLCCTVVRRFCVAPRCVNAGLHQGVSGLGRTIVCRLCVAPGCVNSALHHHVLVLCGLNGCSRSLRGAGTSQLREVQTKRIQVIGQVDLYGDWLSFGSPGCPRPIGLPEGRLANDLM